MASIPRIEPAWEVSRLKELLAIATFVSNVSTIGSVFIFFAIGMFCNPGDKTSVFSANPVHQTVPGPLVWIGLLSAPLYSVN